MSYRLILRASYLVFLTFLLLKLASAVPGQSPTPATLDSESRSEMDLVHYGDIIDVDAVGNFDFDWRGTLTPEGFLDGFDKVEIPIYGLCRSEASIAADIATQYGKFLRDPKIVVRIVDRSRRAEAIVTGAVRTPYRFQIRRPVTLNEVLVLTGGITDRSNGEINIFRPVILNCRETLVKSNDAADVSTTQTRRGTSPSIRIRIADMLSGRPEANPQVQSGDIVTVEEASPIFVVGGVSNPRQISSREQVTLTQAIAGCGGLTKDALADKVTIFRRRGRQTETIHADVSKINKKLVDDIVLRAFDIVDVGQKGRENRRFPPSVYSAPVGGEAGGLQLRTID